MLGATGGVAVRPVGGVTLSPAGGRGAGIAGAVETSSSSRTVSPEATEPGRPRTAAGVDSGDGTVHAVRTRRTTTPFNSASRVTPPPGQRSVQGRSFSGLRMAQIR